tara:strand:+ start:111 stop:479 length:369 start_codon:yes stop_codon:yes gene_type:complete
MTKAQITKAFEELNLTKSTPEEIAVSSPFGNANIAAKVLKNPDMVFKLVSTESQTRKYDDASYKPKTGFMWTASDTKERLHHLKLDGLVEESELSLAQEYKAEIRYFNDNGTDKPYVVIGLG